MYICLVAKWWEHNLKSTGHIAGCFVLLPSLWQEQSKYETNTMPASLQIVKVLTIQISHCEKQTDHHKFQRKQKIQDFCITGLDICITYLYYRTWQELKQCGDSGRLLFEENETESKTEKYKHAIVDIEAAKLVGIAGSKEQWQWHWRLLWALVPPEWDKGTATTSSLQSSLQLYYCCYTLLLQANKRQVGKVIPKHASTESYSSPCFMSDRPKLTCGDHDLSGFFRQKTSGASPILPFSFCRQNRQLECRGQRPLTLKSGL